MKLLIIDPWCSDKYAVYTIGLCDGLSKITDLTLCSSYYITPRDNYKTIPVFFKISDQMQRGKIRTVIRGIEYFLSYCKIMKLIKKEHFDVVHVEWALMHKIDNFFLRRIKNYTRQIVFTSHNVLPHIDGKKYIDELRVLHDNFDTILVHGESIKNEYLSYFPEDATKLKIQRHGVHLSQKVTYNIEKVSPEITKFVNGCSGKLVAFVGLIFYNKGADRVIKYWIENQQNTDNRLIVAGELSKHYKELDEIKEDIQKSASILYLPRYLNDDEFSYVLNKTDIVTIPYRHASMSGIVYSAAAFSKPILYTDTGAISEYVGQDGGLCSRNDDDDLYSCLNLVMSWDENTVVEKGKALHQRIYNEYNWDTIALRLVEEVYCKDNT